MSLFLVFTLTKAYEVNMYLIPVYKCGILKVKSSKNKL